MIRLRYANARDIPELREIYGLCFPNDSEGFKDLFYGRIFGESKTLVIDIGGKIASMLTLMDMNFNFGKRAFNGYYIYAAATPPKHRNLGYFGTLMNHSLKLCGEERKAFILTVPGSLELVSAYRKFGFNLTINRYTSRYFSDNLNFRNLDDLSNNAFSEIGKTEFIKLRNNFISNSKKNIASLDMERFSGHICNDIEIFKGKLIKIENKYGQNYAVCYKMNSELYIREISVDNVCLKSAVCGLLRYLGANSAEVDHFPGLQDEKSDLFGVYRVFNNDCSNLGDIFMSFMFEL